MSAKVCVLTTVHPPFDARIFYKQARTLAMAGYNVNLIAQHDKDDVVEGVKIIGLPRPRNRLHRILSLTWRAFYLALRQRADVYHFHDPELLPVGVLLKLFTRAKVIYDVHENVPKQILNKAWLPGWSKRFIALAYMLGEKIALNFLDWIIIAEDSYIKNYPAYKNVLAIRNYALVTQPVVMRTAAEFERATRNTFNVVYVGGITKLRGAFEMIEALRILKERGYQNIALSLIGRVMPPKLQIELQYLIQQYDLVGNVYILGPVLPEKVFGILAKSHVGVAILHPDPNYVESLPTKLFEYMATGLPVVTSNFPLWREIVEGNACGLCVDPLDPKAIAEGIEYLFTHPKEAYHMGQNGRRAVEEKYNWEGEAKKLLSLYEELLAR